MKTLKSPMIRLRHKSPLIRLRQSGMRWMGLLVAALATTGVAGCGSVESDRLEVICSCENCGDREYQEWETIISAEREIADVYDCYEVLEPLWLCQLDEHECRDGRYEDDFDGCEREFEQYYECLDGRSTREGGPYY